MLSSLSGFLYLDPSTRLVFAVAIGLTVFNVALGFVRHADEHYVPDPTVYMLVPGLLGGWVVKTCYFLLTAESISEARFQSDQLCYAAVAQGLTALALIGWAAVGRCR